MQAKRKKLLINPDFQLKIMGWLTGLALAPICIFFGAHYYFFWKLRKLGKDIQLDSDHIYFRFIEGQSQDLFLIFIMCAVLTIVIASVIGLLLSHRIAGPIHRLKGHLTSLGQGQEVQDLSFRKGDYFTELPPIVNESVHSLKGKGK